MTPRERVVLHVGQHKTGSKALQAALLANRRFLAEHGFAFPLPWRARWSRRPQAANHAALLPALRAGGVGPALRWLLRGHARVILSSEDLFDMRTAHEGAAEPDEIAALTGALAAACADAGASVRIVVYLRRQDHLIAAHHAQWIKGSRIHDDGFLTFLARSRARLDADAILRAWEAAFGIGAITVRPYEAAALPGGIVPDFFARVLGLPDPPRPHPFPGDPEARNVTPPREHVELLRLVNRRAAAGAAVLPRAPLLVAAAVARGPRGAEAYLSPADRAALLARCEAGNRAIARRYGVGETLFREGPPDPGAAPPLGAAPPHLAAALPPPGDAWPPPPVGAALARAIAIDAAARRALARSPSAALRVRARMLARGRAPRRAAFVVPPDADEADVALAWRAFAAIVADPAWVPSWESAPAGLGFPRVGPPSPAPLARSWWLLGAAPTEARLARALALPTAGFVAADEATRAAWRRAAPALARAHVLAPGATDLPWLRAQVPQVVR